MTVDDIASIRDVPLPPAFDAADYMSEYLRLRNKVIHPAVAAVLAEHNLNVRVGAEKARDAA